MRGDTQMDWTITKRRTMRTLAIIAHVSMATLVGCVATGDGEQPTEQSPRSVVAASAAEVQPLEVGDVAPVVTLHRPDGTTVDTDQLFAERLTVLVIYRGGWCPFCTRHLMELATAEAELRQLGYQVVAVSIDRPEELARSIAKAELNYTLLSDSDASLAKAMGLAFRVDDATYARLASKGMDLEQASGRDHHILPVPAIYLLDRKSVVYFAHWNPDYKTRLSGDDLLAAARRMVDENR